MTQFAVSTTTEQTIYAALELSKNSWLLAIQVAGRDKPSLHPIKGGNSQLFLLSSGDLRRGLFRLPARVLRAISASDLVAGLELILAAQ